MNEFRSILRLPLLGKELTEQAARKRTYLVRVVYAALLFGVFAIIYSDFLCGVVHGNPVYALGRGRELFTNLAMCQFAGIFLFLPAMMAGVITAEKERASLGLLFLTDLGPWEMIFQKYLGRLIPMFTFLLLSLPLMAFAYSLGGISTDFLLSGIWLLLLACLQVGALALFSSAFCRSTVGATMASYLGGALLYLGLPVLVLLLKVFGAALAVDEDNLFFFFPPYVLFEKGENDFARSLQWSVPIVLSTALFLLLARVCLRRRAFVEPRNLLLHWFHRLDRLFKAWNRKIGGIELFEKPDALPDDAPVAWRELQRRSLGRVSYLFRIFVLLEAPTAFLGVAVMAGRGHIEGLSAMVFGLWVLAALTITVQGANTIASERTHQTLEVLLATPLAAGEIVRQKMRALRRLLVVFAVPLVTLFSLEAWWKASDGVYDSDLSAAAYWVCSVLTVAIYLPMIAWLGMWIGLKIRGRARATMTALVVLVLWCGLAPLTLILLEESNVMHIETGSTAYLFLFSPAMAIPLTELFAWRDIAHYRPAALFVNFAGYALVWYTVRRLCLNRAERYLRGG